MIVKITIRTVMAYKVKLDKEKLQKELTPLEYNVCLNHGTESPFHNEFWDSKNKRHLQLANVVQPRSLLQKQNLIQAQAGRAIFNL